MPQTTIRHHVYQVPNAPHNRRDLEQIAAENACNQNRYIDPHGEHETWVRDFSTLEAYQEVFGAALDSYNNKQKRKDRRMTMEQYLESVEKDTRGRKNKAIATNNERTGRNDKAQGKRPSIEVVVSVGNVVPAHDSKGRILRDRNCKRVTPQRIPADANRQIQKAYWETFEERNPNMFIARVDYHADEYYMDKVSHQWEKGIEHSHGEIIPFAGGYTRGLSRQCSIGRALAQMGFKDGWDEDGNRKTAYEFWSEREREYIETVLIPQYLPEYEIEHPYHDRHAQGRNTAEYQELQDLQIEIAQARELKAIFFKHRSEALTDRTKAVELRDTARREAALAVAERDKMRSDVKVEQQALNCLRQDNAEAAALNFKLYGQKRELEDDVAALQVEADRFPQNLDAALTAVHNAQKAYSEAVSDDTGHPLIRLAKKIRITVTRHGKKEDTTLYDVLIERQQREQARMEAQAEQARQAAVEVQRRLQSLQQIGEQRGNSGDDEMDF